MIKAERFTDDEQELASIAKALSHPARIAILKFLAEQNCCISGDITNEIPLSRTTVSQHLSALKKLGFIQGTVDGVKVNYCLDTERIKQLEHRCASFFNSLITHPQTQCNS